MPGSVRPVVGVIALALVLALTGCGGGGSGEEAATTVPCNDVPFRAQDEELYVTKAAISNAIGAAGAPAALLLDLRRARGALGGYLDAHPPCDSALTEIETTERDALAALDAAITSLTGDKAAGDDLTSALKGLTEAQQKLAG